ncbi:MAG: zinc ribbon domain-containing protein [Gemmatimonadaceae bacterium]
MPTYEFTCPDGHDFDKFFRSMASAPTVVPCPVCGKPADRQMSAGAGLVFHGTGFYITDYGKDGKKDQKAAAGRRTDATSKGDSSSGSHESDSGSKSTDPKSEGGSPTSSSSDSKGADSKGPGTSADSGATTAPAPAAPVKPAAAPKASE